MTPSDRGLIDRLRRARDQRAPFARLTDKLIGVTLQRFPADSGRIVEIGSGDGWLRERLPESVRVRAVHTEPAAIAVEEFRQRHPEAPIVQGSAEQLPFADGELSALLGACVLDMVEDGQRVAREAARVLRPGGILIHWLDLSTRLNAIFDQLAGSTLVPIPNVFSDPSAAAWPEDLFLVQRRELEIVLEVLARHGHPLSSPLEQYLRLFSSDPFPLRSAIAEFVKLTESAQHRRALKLIFSDAAKLMEADPRAQPTSFSGRPVSSARHFEHRLRHWFLPQAGFRVELSEVARAWELDERRASDAFVYESSCVGEQRQLPAPPEALLCPEANLPLGAQVLRELGVFVFVASRS